MVVEDVNLYNTEGPYTMYFSSWSVSNPLPYKIYGLRARDSFANKSAHNRIHTFIVLAAEKKKLLQKKYTPAVNQIMHNPTE